MMELQAAKSMHTEEREEEQESKTGRSKHISQKDDLNSLGSALRIPNVLSKKKKTVMKCNQTLLH